MRTDLVNKALTLVTATPLFQEGARRVLNENHRFQNWKEGAAQLSWSEVIHLSQDEPGLLVAALLFFAARAEEALGKARGLFAEDGFQLSFAFPRTDVSSGAVNELLLRLDNEYTCLVVPAALPAIERRAAERHGTVQGDDGEILLNPGDWRAIQALTRALSDLMTRVQEEQLRIQRLAH